MHQVDIVRVLADVARALVRLHAAGHVHRDVKAGQVESFRVQGVGFNEVLRIWGYRLRPDTPIAHTQVSSLTHVYAQVAQTSI